MRTAPRGNSDRTPSRLSASTKMAISTSASEIPARRFMASPPGAGSKPRGISIANEAERLRQPARTVAGHVHRVGGDKAGAGVDDNEDLVAVVVGAGDVAHAQDD